MRKLMYQQGDVLLFRCNAVAGKKLDHLTLAEGEATGHKHQVIDGDAELFVGDNGTLFLSVKSDTATLSHEEHKNQVIEKGNYKIGIVREYDHFSEEARNVAD